MTTLPAQAPATLRWCAEGKAQAAPAVEAEAVLEMGGELAVVLAAFVALGM
jgi:hypothetical protein